MKPGNPHPIPKRPITGLPSMAHEGPPPEPQLDGQWNGQAPPMKAKSLKLIDGARAVGVWLLLEKPEPDDEKSAGGVILPSAVREKPAWIVRSKGEGVTIEVKVGDHVAFDGTRIISDGKTSFAFAMQGQIMGVLNPAALKDRIITQTAGI